MLRNRTTATALLLVLVPVVVLIPLLFAAATGTSDSLAENRKKIAAMSQAQREQLETHYQQYRRLSQEEQQRLREVHAAMQGNSRLQEATQQYEKWLATITPWQRAELREETDPLRRVALVRRFEQERREEQKRLQEERERRGRGPEPGPFSWWDLRHIATLDSEDLKAALDRIEAVITPSPQLRQRLEMATRPKRDLVVLLAALQQASPGESQWLPRETAEWIISRIENEEQREFVQGLQREAQQTVVARILVKSVLVPRGIWSGDLTREDLLQVIQNLDKEDQEELSKLPRDRMERSVRYRWMMQQVKDMEKELGELSEAYYRVFPRRPMGPPRFDRGWDGNGDGRRGPRRGPPPDSRPSDEDPAPPKE